MVQIAQRFDYGDKKKTLVEIIEKFDKFYELTRELYEPFVKGEPIEKIREKNIELIKKNLNELMECYEQPVNACFKFAMKNYKEDFTKDNSYEDLMLFYFILDKIDAYSDLLKFLSSEHVPLWWVQHGLSNFVFRNIKKDSLDISSGIGERSLKFKNALKLYEELSEKILYLQQSSWEEVLDYMTHGISLSDGKLFKKINGSSNVIVEFSSYMPSSPFSFVIKSGKKGLGYLKSEKEIIEYINRIISNGDGHSHKNFFDEEYGFHAHDGALIKLPGVIFFSDKISFEYDWLALRNETKGKKFMTTKFTDKQRRTCLHSILDFLAYVHTMVPINISQKGKVDISYYIKNRLDNKFFDLKEDLKSKLYENLNPVLDCLIKSPYGLNKDAHLDNFLIHEMNHPPDEEPKLVITAVDWEDKGFQPIYLDIVNLLEYLNEFTDDEKEDYIQGYISSFNHYNSIKNIKQSKEETLLAEYAASFSWCDFIKKAEQNTESYSFKNGYDSNFKLSYLNAIIYRSICFSSAWSNPGRESDRQKRTRMLDKAVKSIAKINENHTEYYNKYKDNYGSLRSVLEETINHLSMSSG